MQQDKLYQNMYFSGRLCSTIEFNFVKSISFLQSFHGKSNFSIFHASETFSSFFSHILPLLPHKTDDSTSSCERKNGSKKRQIIEKTCCIKQRQRIFFTFHISQFQLSGVRRHSLTRSCFYNLLLFLLRCCVVFVFPPPRESDSRVQNDHTGGRERERERERGE